MDDAVGVGGKRKRRSSGGEEKKKEKSKYEGVFLGFKKELNAKYDAQERLVKLSRDVTIQSKRVIFNLHQFSGASQESKQKVLSESENKIQDDIVPKLKAIALELKSRDPNQFIRSYTIGVQEFIEAFTFLHYLKSGHLISYEKIQKYLTFTVVGGAESQDVTPEDGAKQNLLPLSRADFLLGVADLTGELMRLCINAVGSGNSALPFDILSFMRTVWQGFLGIDTDRVKYLDQKMSVLNASLCKVENVCYNIKMRGSESHTKGSPEAVSSSTEN